MRETRSEIRSVGYDPAFQALGSDPRGSANFTGLVIPTAPATTAIPANRYLFLLDMVRLGPEEFTIIDGIRQAVTIASTVTSDAEDPCPYVNEIEVTSPFWHFSDANIVWYLMKVPPDAGPPPSDKTRDGMAFRYANTAALLCENFPEDAGGYTAPNGGMPYGYPIGGLGPMYDLSFPWRSQHAWSSLGIEVQGPGDVALFASVQQTVPATRCNLVVPGSVTLPGGIGAFATPEDLFVMNARAVADASAGTEAIYRRIAGSIVIGEPSPYWRIPKDEQSRTWTCNDRPLKRAR